MPLVTIYIPTRNRPELLERAVRSCLLQTIGDFELIIVDDGSSPEFQPQLQAIATLDSRIRLFQLPESQGACVARNLAIAQAQGDYITGLDDDDEFLPQRLANLLQAIASHPQASFISTAYQIKSRRGRLLSSNAGARTVTLNDLLFSNIAGNQVFTRTLNLREIGGFDPQLTACQDYDTWIRLAQRFGSGYRIAGASYLIRLDHELPRISNDHRRRQGYLYLYEKHQHLMNESQKASQQFFRLLYTEKPGLVEILRFVPRQKIFVALKVYLLRKIGYDI
ncbi:glycosyltransferase [Rheinheimera sp.]|uniref:glycosyltransferase n=1 Tax=Rheinheimera sp. TaxID=1869214 RepID=UPI003D2D40CC